jgi:hypothetical protein
MPEQSNTPNYPKDPLPVRFGWAVIEFWKDVPKELRDRIKEFAGVPNYTSEQIAELRKQLGPKPP